jgi:hypothetical protein
MQLVLSCARGDALAVGVTSAREGEGASLFVSLSSRATTPSYEGPGPSFYRCKERVQVYNGGVAICQRGCRRGARALCTRCRGRRRSV